MSNIISLDWRGQMEVSTGNMDTLKNLLANAPETKNELMINNARLRDVGVVNVIKSIVDTGNMNIIKVTFRNCEVGSYNSKHTIIDDSKIPVEKKTITVPYPDDLVELNLYLPSTNIQCLVFQNNNYCPETFIKLSKGLEGSKVRVVFVDGNLSTNRYAMLVKILNIHLEEQYQNSLSNSPKLRSM